MREGVRKPRVRGRSEARAGAYRLQAQPEAEGLIKLGKVRATHLAKGLADQIAGNRRQRALRERRMEQAGLAPVLDGEFSRTQPIPDGSHRRNDQILRRIWGMNDDGRAKFDCRLVGKREG